MKITTTLGFSLLTIAAVASVVYENSALNISEVVQFGVLAAGAVALLFMTVRRTAK